MIEGYISIMMVSFPNTAVGMVSEVNDSFVVCCRLLQGISEHKHV